MTYKITVQKLTIRPDEKYPHGEDIYTQVVEDIDLKAVIDAVNNSSNK